MTTTYYNIITGSRIVSADRTTDHSGSDDTAVTDWTIGTDFVLCVHQFDNSKNTEAGTYKLQWNKDGGSFTDLAASGELNYSVGGATDLTDGTACVQGDWWCTEENETPVDGTEREDSNATVAFDGTDDDETEHQWAIATDSATGGSVYDFQLVDTANGDRIDAIGVTITMAAGAISISPDAANHSHAAGTASVTKQALSISPAVANHSQAAGTAGTSVGRDITPLVANHSQAAGTAGFTVERDVTPAVATHSHVAGEPTFTFERGVTPAVANHSHAADQAGATVSGAIGISPDGAAHTHTAGTAGFTIERDITPTLSNHAQAAGQPTFTIERDVSPDSASHSHAAGTASVIRVFSITPDAANHVQAAGSPAFTVERDIAPLVANHTHAADSSLFTVLRSITPIIATHSQAAGSPAMGLNIIPISPDDGVHGGATVPTIFVGVDDGSLYMRKGGVVLRL